MKPLKSKMGLPRIVYIGNEEPELKSLQLGSHESNELDVLYLRDDENINKYIISFNPDCIITTGNSSEEYPNLMNLSIDIRRRWLNLPDCNKEEIGEMAYNCAMNYILSSQTHDLISFFTPIYNTGETLLRTYESIKKQTYINWEWVIVNDSTDDGKTLKIAEDIAAQDLRVKVYDFKEKSGGLIGEVKHRAACMCNGDYLAELDHDDYLMPDCALDIVAAFKKYPEVGFVYSDCAEIDENWNSLTYQDGFAFGYGKYENQFVMGKLMKVYISMNINPKTIRHIVGVPNHIRVWRKSVYHEIGGHNRRLSIADDYELLVRTFLSTKLMRIPKIGYLQFIYSNQNAANTHDTARADIQRRVRSIAGFYNQKIKERFEELGVTDWAYEENPNNPLLTESRFGKEEGYVNLIDL
ncbi:glycosyltransferase [Flavobacterium sp. ACN6]|uniref:glycosyltransferase n=1 Tax=Flavobacterium sp. ACN6 TaxID=1920426 RepID=UPI000BB39381|nr:glycosyltransferase [Flavobacterium sp. ACN6]PBJ06767.1 Chondroitin synthase [Flavobacterium sp. ACN6]